ncbi:MAG TPA: family 10 glycosylhydrolase [Tepidisphaeraceae bacterium]|jgi:uncharacterized lipoprotein YddW (UPF0748 family)
MLRILLAVLSFASLAVGQTAPAERVAPASYIAPPTPREFRAAWVATVGNSTWPTKRDLSVDEQKKEMIALLDRAVELRLNVIIIQVRTQCDALYESKIEPWSEFLTGTEGKAPEPRYDPLAMWIEESHKRGLELHAWFNPYRAKSGNAKGERAANHISKTKPQIVRQYGPQLWLDPGDPETIEYSLGVFMDVVKRYDIDGVHIDDYFYPYKITEPAEGEAPPASAPGDADDDDDAATKPATVASAPTTRPGERGRGRGRGGERQRRRPVDFPDDPTWAKYQQTGGKLARNDWRRQNVNTLIERLYNAIKTEKRTVKFGISPFGIWRPGNPRGITGLDSYEQLYADSRLWLTRGWCDYFSPQLYWGNEGPQAYPALFNWWTQQNNARRFLFPGIAVGRREAVETIKQITTTRGRPNPGVVHWSARSLMHNEKLCDALVAGPYAEQSLVPASTWLDNVPPGKPEVSAVRNADGSATVRIGAAPGESPWLWAVKARYGTKWKFFVGSAGSNEVALPADAKTGVINSVIVTAVDRSSNESERVAVGLTPAGK